jgi:hypothetical protein
VYVISLATQTATTHFTDALPQVKVHSAPHLSTPCCVAEPLAEYALLDLPERYTKLYADTTRVVNKLKQRIPKVGHVVEVKAPIILLMLTFRS